MNSLLHNSYETLGLNYAVLSCAAGKPTQEDAAGACVPADHYIKAYKGSSFVVTDGVSTAEAGQQASQTATDTFLKDYFTTPDTWSVKQSVEQVLSTINLRLYRHSYAFNQSAHTGEQKGFLCTLSGLVLKSHTAHLFHIGDSRIYLFRAGQLTQKTQDHRFQTAQNHSFLARALGMSNHLQLDYQQLPLEVGDCLLLSTDGLHDFVSAQDIQNILAENSSLEEKLERLYQVAMANGCDDNLSAILVQVASLPNLNKDTFQEQLVQLPFPPAFGAGMKVDGYEIVHEVFASNRSHLYLAQDLETGQQVALKAPSANFSDDSSYIERFIREEWIGQRISSPHVVRVIRPTRPKTFLYYVMDFVAGISLESWLEQQSQPIRPKRVLQLLEQVAQGIQAFHQCETIHQDLKPGNIMVQSQTNETTGALEEKAIIIDFGSVFVSGVAEIFIPIEHEAALGTASYSDPLYLTGKNSAIQGDIYSLATIAYELFTGKLPYGTAIEACQTPRDFDALRYIPARQVNPRIPIWLDRALEKGVHFDLQQRYRSLDAFMQDIRQPNPEFLREEVKKNTKNSSLLFWQLLSGFWFITLLLVIYLFVLNRG